MFQNMRLVYRHEGGIGKRDTKNELILMDSTAISRSNIHIDPLG